MHRCIRGGIGVALATFVFAGAAIADETPRPRPPSRFSTGPHAVGVRTIVFVDASRDDPYAGGRRTLVTDIWYPADEAARSGKTTTFSEFFGRHREAAKAFVDHFGSGTVADVNARFRSLSVRDAPMLAGRYPLLVFSHGNGGVRHQNVFQMDHLASHGYIVVSPDHTGNAAVTPLPDRALRYNNEGRGFSAKNRPLDVSFLITRLLAASDGKPKEGGAKSASWLAGAIDAEKIGVLGHSFGGFTACRVADIDPRVKAIVPMTVSYGKRTALPVLVMLADLDRTMGAAGNAVSRLYYQSCTGPKYLLSIRRAGHFSYTDMNYINPTFGDGIGVDRKTGEEFLPIDRAKKIINAYTLAFFDHYLRADRAAGAFLQTNVDVAEIALENANLASDVSGSPGSPAASR